VRFNTLGEVPVEAQHTWEQEAGSHLPHVAFVVDSMEEALHEISKWCTVSNEAQPKEVWQNNVGTKKIISLSFLPYNIELMQKE
jgi:hypothetical protein